MNIEKCIKKGFIKKVEIDEKLTIKEMNEADYDLEKAKKAYEDEDFKWRIVKSYYCMFHAGKALLFSLGYQEKNILPF